MVQLLSLSDVHWKFLMSLYSLTTHRFFFFSWIIIFHCLDVPWCIYPFTHWRISWWILSFGNYELSCYKQLCVVFLGYIFSSLGKYQGVWLLDFLLREFSLVVNCQTVFQNSCTILRYDQQWMNVCCFTSSFPFNISVLLFGHPTGCVVVSHYCFGFLLLLFLKCIYFWLNWIFISLCGFLLVAASGGYFVVMWGVLIAVAFLVLEHRLLSSGFSSCSTWAQYLWCTGLVALQHVEFSLIKDRTCPLIGTWILIYSATREVPESEN